MSCLPGTAESVLQLEQTAFADEVGPEADQSYTVKEVKLAFTPRDSDTCPAGPTMDLALSMAS